MRVLKIKIAVTVISAIFTFSSSLSPPLRESLLEAELGFCCIFDTFPDQSAAGFSSVKTNGNILWASLATLSAYFGVW